MTNKLFSARFDCKVLLPGILAYCKKTKTEISCIKKGTSFFAITLKKKLADRVAVLSIRDILHYNAPTSLDVYLKTWNGYFSKSIFPYTYYKSIEEMRKAKDFPPSEAFFNDLKQVYYTCDQKLFFIFKYSFILIISVCCRRSKLSKCKK